MKEFWDTVQYDKSVGCYRCQLDEQWFNLTKDTLRYALQITPAINNQAFTSLPLSDALINFVNELGYPKLIRNLSNVITNDMFQLWRALTTIINLCLTGKTPGFERPRAPVLQILWGIRKHKFHPRLGSPLYLPNEEPVLGYFKFSAKGTKREVFGMPILVALSQHTYKPTKTAKKSKPTAPKVDPRPPVSKPASSKQPEPKPAPAKTHGKKRKLATEIFDKPSKAKKIRPGSVSKRRKPISSLRALEESLKSMYDVPRGPLPLVVIREPESGKYQPLPEVPGKGKEKVIEEQIARDLLTLQMPKKKSPADRYIFQRRTSTPTGSSGHDESSSLYAELGLTDSEEESEKDVSGADAGVQGEGQAGPDPGAQDEGQAGSNPDEQAEGQAGPDPGNAEASQPLPSPIVHAGSDLEHMDLDVADVLSQPPPEQIDEGFTATAYLKVQENLKLKVEEQVILEEPASSLGTLSSLQHLTKDLSFGDLFFSDKPSEADNDKATTKTKAESMVSITIQQDTSSIPSMTTPIIDLTSRPESPKVHQLLKATAIETTTTTTTILPPPSQQQQSTTNAMMMKRIDELEHIMANLNQENKRLEQRLDSHRARLYTLEQLDIPHQMNRDHFEELAKDLAEARKKKKKSHESPKTPPGSPPHQSPHPPLPAAKYQAWTTTDIRLRPSISLTPADLEIDDDMALDEQAQSTDDEDIGNAHIPNVNLRQDWWKPLEEERPATSEPAWFIPLSDVLVPTSNWASALASTYSPPPEDSLLVRTGPAFEIIKVFHPNVIHLQYQMEECHKLLNDSVDDSILRYNVSKPLPLGGPPGQVTIQSDFFFNKDLEYLRYSSKGSRLALSISKMKAAYYPDVGLEQMVPDQMWIEEEYKYDIDAMYGISHWSFQRQRFYIDRHTSEGDRRAVRTHMRILSVVRIKVFSMYGYAYMKKIVLRRADLNEHFIAERDFKYLYPKDFQLGIESYQTQLNLTKPRWDATGFEYKHDYTVIDSLRVITFGDRYGVQMIMRFNEVHKFSYGTLQQINEALDYWVKEFKINRMNPGLNTRFWTRKDVDRRKEFMFAI
nr:hypothetical protein [Tanacetum cinerariifolium]